MNTNPDNGESIDPEVREKLNLLRATPPRNPDEVSRRRQMFLSELDSMPGIGEQNGLAWLRNWFRKSARGRDIRRPKTKLSYLAFAAAIVVVLFILSGTGITAYASQAALPGDTLYSFKTGIENTRAALASNAYDEAQLYLRFAQIRLDEISLLIKHNRYEDIHLPAVEFESYIQKVMEILNTGMVSDPELGSQLNQQVTAALLTYTQTLEQYWSNVPENTKRSIVNAILASEESSEEQSDKSREIEITGMVQSKSTNTWIIDGHYVAISDHTELSEPIKVGDMVKVHAFLGGGDTYIAKQIELTNDQDIGNNQEDNEEGVDSGNLSGDGQETDESGNNFDQDGSQGDEREDNGSSLDNHEDSGGEEGDKNKAEPTDDKLSDDSNHETEPNND